MDNFQWNTLKGMVMGNKTFENKEKVTENNN